MARMRPSLAVPLSARGEEKFYEYIEAALPDEYMVFHRLPLVCQRDGERVYESDLDFLIVHQRKGLLNIEVKGGDRIRYSAKSGVLLRGDGEGGEEMIEDPFRQAQNGIHNLVYKVEESGIFSDKLPVCFGYAVAFPDASLKTKYLPTHIEQELVIDQEDLGSLRQKIEGLYEFWAKGRESKQGIGDREFQLLLDHFLMPEFRLAPSLVRQIEEEESAVVRLTEEQHNYLDFMGDRKRALIRGYAGTGKTQLALEQSRRLSRLGLKVLVLCFNEPLALFLAERMKEISCAAKASHFHGLCKEWATEAGLDYNEPSLDQPKEIRDGFFNKEVANILAQASDRISERYDAIIIDEGQDFSADWFGPLLGLLVDPTDGYLFIFYDETQNIYEKELEFPIDGPPYNLGQNCRSTRNICEFASSLIDIEMVPASHCLEGAAVELLNYQSEESQLEKIRRVVRSLIKNKLKPEDIVILSPHRKARSCLRDASKIESIPISMDPLPKEGHIRFSTLHRFKGLEGNAVIICDLDGRMPACEAHRVCVAATRAKHLLYIIHHDKFRPWQQ